MKRFFLSLALTVGATLICVHCVAVEETISKLSKVPDDLYDTQRVELKKQRGELLQERAALKARIEQHEKKWAEEGSTDEAVLRSEGDELRAEKQKHIEASNAFNRYVDLAVNVRPGTKNLYSADVDKLHAQMQNLPIDATKPTPKQPFLRPAEPEEKTHTIMLPTWPAPVPARVPKSVEEKPDNPHGNENPTLEADPEAR